MEFKYKNTKWSLGGISGRMITTNQYGGFVADVDTLENAVLIKEAPRMLNLLEEMVSDFENSSKSSSDILMESLGKAKQLIKEATEL